VVFGEQSVSQLFELFNDCGQIPHLAVAAAGADGVGSPSTRTRRRQICGDDLASLQYQSRLHQSQITSHRSLGSHGLGRGRGVGRTLGIGLPLGVGVGRGVAVAVGVGVAVAHGVSVYVRDWFCGGGSGQQMQKSSV
jgi:hypothetical protein